LTSPTQIIPVIKSFSVTSLSLQQLRNKWADARMIRDHKRRVMSVQYADQRLRINALRKNNILPMELRELADAEIAALPRDSAPVRTHARCSVTSRARGTVHWHRLSRIVWRHYADYNKISGVMRAMW